MVEEGFAESAVTNFTQRFYDKGFVASYNVPYDPKVYKALKYEECSIYLIQINILMKMTQGLHNLLITVQESLITIH